MSSRVSELPEPFQGLEYVPPEPLMHEQGGACVWMMRKNCSATPRQVLGFYASVSSLSLAFAVVFAVRGLWVVLPFSVLESLVLGAALLYYARHAMDRECVRLHRGRLLVEVVASDRVTQHRFEAACTHLEWDERDALWLCAPGRRLRIGGYLTVTRRRAFARELAARLGAQGQE